MLLYSFSAFSQNNSHAHIKNSKWRTCMMVSWGNPENNCTGFGICKIYQKNDAGIYLKESTPATLELTNNNLLMIVNRDDLKGLINQTIYDELCQARSIHLPNEVIFSEEVRSNIAISKNSKSSFLIPRGNYNVSHKGKNILIFFKIREINN